MIFSMLDLAHKLLATDEHGLRDKGIRHFTFFSFLTVHL